MKTLEKFLIKHNILEKNILNYAKDLTLEQFYNNCKCVEWLIWVFSKTNPNDIKYLILAAAHCAKEIEHLLSTDDGFSKQILSKALNASLNFNSYSKKELEKFWLDACVITLTSRYVANYATTYIHKSTCSYLPEIVQVNACEAISNSSRAAYYTSCAASDSIGEAVQAAAYAARYAGYALNNSEHITRIVKQHLPFEIWNHDAIIT